MYDEETEYSKLVEKTVREAMRSPERINHDMIPRSKVSKKQNRVYVEDFGFDESPVVKRNRSKSDPYAGGALSISDNPHFYKRSISNEATVSSEDLRKPTKSRTRKFSLINTHNKVGPMDSKNTGRPQSEVPPSVKTDSKRPVSEQSPRKEKTDSDKNDIPDSKTAWQTDGIYV